MSATPSARSLHCVSSTCVSRLPRVVLPAVRSVLASARTPALWFGLTLSAAGAAHAQSAPGSLPTIPGYAPATAAAQRQLEQQAIAGPLPARARAHSATLSREPHVAGTAAQERTRDYVIAQMKTMGLETEVRTYDVWLPHATSVTITRMGRDTVALELAEPPIPGDPATQFPQYPTANGSTGDGIGEGELVFVNFGLIEDYATLDSLGVSVKGKVVLARYGRSFRGIKAREAEKRGPWRCSSTRIRSMMDSCRGTSTPMGRCARCAACSAAACSMGPAIR